MNNCLREYLEEAQQCLACDVASRDYCRLKDKYTKEVIKLAKDNGYVRWKIRHQISCVYTTLAGENFLRALKGDFT